MITLIDSALIAAKAIAASPVLPQSAGGRDEGEIMQALSDMLALRACFKQYGIETLEGLNERLSLAARGGLP